MRLPQAARRSHADRSEAPECSVGVAPASLPQPVAQPVDDGEPPSRRGTMLLTVRDVEAELQLGRTRTYELLRSGEIPIIRIGRVLRVPRDALQRWIDTKCLTKPPDADDVVATQR